jgi:hypothetical protein
MEFEAIGLCHRPAVDGIRAEYGHTSSSHAFMSLFLWRFDMGLSLFAGDRFFVARCRRRGENCYFFPCGDAADAARFIHSHMGEPDFKLCYLRDADADFLKSEFPGRFSIEYDRDSAEYLYDRAAQVQMKGGRYAKLRQRVSGIERRYELEIEGLSPENLAQSREFVINWRKQRKELFQTGFDDMRASVEALEMREELGLFGVLERLNGVPCAVLAGGFISGDTFDLCMAKTLSCVSGFDFYARRALYERLPDECRLINREEDLGIDGLRESKLRMRPCAIVGMWEAAAARE